MSIETMTKLATVTVGAGGSSTIDFTNIPQTYTDLKLVLSARSTQTDFEVTDVNVSFNGVTTNQSERNLRAYPTTNVTSQNRTDIILGNMPSSINTASTFANSELYIANYASANNKSMGVDGVSPSNTNSSLYWWINMGANLWSNTAAITSITLRANNGNWNFAQHTTATLYGIRNMRRAAGNSIKATGGNITFDGTYVYHSFNTSGIFTPTSSLTGSVLVVAGGGGGASPWNDAGGGGGAGGLLLHNLQTLSLGNTYTVTVGSGGAVNTQGNNSQFSSLTASVGGGRGGRLGTNSAAGGNGGSGGGTGPSSSATPGQATSGQGNNGGLGSGGSSGGGGGGGAGAVGGNATTIFNSSGGAGGAGTNAYASWYPISNNGFGGYIAGGGGGGAYTGYNVGITTGAGGLGGGGAGGGNGVNRDQPAIAGAVNTGGGGGGTGYFGSSLAGAAGGSGVVIIRYKA